MIRRYSKKYIQELIQLIKVHGYWSKEVKDFNEKFEYFLTRRINDDARLIIRN